MSPAVNGEVETEEGGGDVPVPKKPPPKHTTVEKMYQKKSQLEHILLRPDTYIGSVEHTKEVMWIHDSESDAMVQKEISFVPGLYKIFDEILVNAADNKQRDPNMDCIKIEIDAEENTISVWNNGQGIPVVEHKDEKMYVPTMIFGHLLTSSNYNDEEEKVTGGRNGYGAKLCNIFSTKFVVETSSKEYKRRFKQTWADNMSKTTNPSIKEASGSDYTKVTFCPDLAKFHMDKLDSDIVGLMSRRAFDVAASTRGVKVFLNGKRLPIKTFKDYVDLYIKDKEDELGTPLKVVYEQVNPRWEIAVTMSDRGFQQVSFVNSIATTKGGRHVDHVADALVKQLIDTIKKKNKGGMTIKPFQVKNHMWLFVNCLIVNPTFDSQTKENMTLQAKNFGSKCTLPEKFILSVTKSGIIESVLTWAKFKADIQLQKSCSGKKQTKLKGIPKLEDANDAGTKNSVNCTLILTEGDSAKSLAVSGLGVVGRDKYGVFPLKGKLLNVREATHKQIVENAEINNIIKILGLVYKKKYETMEDLKSLRYGRLMIMTDQDQDGSHIKGLIINFIHTNWPSLLKLPFLEEFITPIVKATKNKQEFSFFSLPEFEEWKKATDNWHTYKIKYYKGLGTSTSKEAKEYFSDMDRHRILFKYQGDKDDSHIQMAFSKKLVDSRKEWLTSWMTDCKRRAELGLPEDYLYTKATKSVTYTDFINKELVLFSNMDNERSIPSMMDGLKPGSRKVLFTCLKRNDKREVKVAQLAGSVAEHSAYHHGEMSLMTTIINLAQNFVGSNNISLLQPIGQFGTRLQGGKDAASPRYIFTMLSPVTRLIFHPHDDPILKYLRDDNQKIEPEWYIPIIPMMLVNGADGIGTGWMTKIPNHNPRELVEVLKAMMRDEEPNPVIPWYKNFRGDIERISPERFVISGEISIINDQKVEITELPVGTWTQAYKESVLEVMLHGAGEKSPPLITDYKEYNTDTTVKFVVTMSRDTMIVAENEGLHKIFKLQSTYTTSSMCCFDRGNVLRKFDNVMDIIKEFYVVRLEFYDKRKAYLEGMLEAEARKLSNQARFIVEKCDGKLVIENKKKKAMIEELVKRGYDSDPVKGWKLQQDRDAILEMEEEGGDTDPDKEEDQATGPDYDYLLGMTMWSLTKEKKDELLRKKDEKHAELKTLQSKSPKDLWTEDLDALLIELDKVEEKERKDGEDKPVKGAKGSKGALLGGKKKITLTETMPSPVARRVTPIISDDMKKKFEKLTQAKENKGKRQKKVKEGDEKDEFDAMVDDQKPFNDRLGTSPDIIEKKRKAQKAMKQTKLDFKAKKGVKSPKKKRNRNSSDESEDEINSDSDASISTSRAKISQPSRNTARRSAAANIKFNFDDSSADEFEDDPDELFDNDAVLEDKDKPMIVDDEDDFIPDGEDEKPKQKAPVKKEQPKPKPKPQSSDSDSDFGANKTYSKKDDEPSSDALFDSLLKSDAKKPMQLDSGDENSPVKKKPAKAPAQKKPKKVAEDKPKTKNPAQKRPKKKDSDSSNEDFSKTISKKKKKAASSEENSDFEEKLPVRTTSARARKPMKFDFGGSSDSE